VSQPFLSVVVVLYNMRREAARTLHSLSAAYQQGVSANDYEVHVVENGSVDPVDPSFVRQFGCNFHYHRLESPPPSPAYALNYGVAQSSAEHIALMIDGAHIVTPKIVRYADQVRHMFPRPVVVLRRFYLGPGQQPETTQAGYCQEAEDRLLDSINWPHEPYRLFEVSVSIGKKYHPGWFGRFFESNCLIMPRSVLHAMGGCNEAFDIPGGGFLNLDILARASEVPGTQLLALLGEGTFHQVHHGTTSNVPRDELDRRVKNYAEQYEQIRGIPYELPDAPVEYFGHMPAEAFLFGQG